MPSFVASIRTAIVMFGCALASSRIICASESRPWMFSPLLPSSEYSFKMPSSRRLAYAVTSYGSQGKTVDYVLFSDSTVKAATNAQQWYVTISRGRRGVRIFTPDKEQLRENVFRFGHRPLALELADDFVPRRGDLLWDRLHGYLLRFGQRAADIYCHLKTTQRKNHQQKQKYEHKNTGMLGERSKRNRSQNRISP
jgi:hypothetical protein